MANFLKKEILLVALCILVISGCIGTYSYKTSRIKCETCNYKISDLAECKSLCEKEFEKVQQEDNPISKLLRWEKMVLDLKYSSKGNATGKSVTCTCTFG